MLPWEGRADIEPVAQQYQDYCAAACVQIILGGMGLRGLGPNVQKIFNTSITNVKGPWRIGNPAGVAYTINRYNCGNPTDPPPSPPPSKEYRTLRTGTPYEACSAIVNSLKGYNSATVVQVLGSQHWIVVHGASGHGNPLDGTSYTVDTLFLCNPDNGHFGGIPNASDPGTGGFCLERVTYADFVNTYFTGCYDGVAAFQEYGDGREFIIVTDSRAEPRPQLLLPTPEIPKIPTLSLDIGKISLGSNEWLAAADRRRPLLVQRLDRCDEYYYLVPFVLKDGNVNLVRLDANGTYLGTATCCDPDARLFDDDRPLGLIRSAATLGLSVDDQSRFVNDVLVWHPCLESASPYKPFRVFNDGTRAYASLSGVIFPQLHDRETRRILDLPPPKRLA